jgi:hypothetical protein
MALQIALTSDVSKTGVSASAAYAKIEVFRSWAGDTFVLVNFFESEAARRADKSPIHWEEFKAPTEELEGKFYPTVYAFLKTLPEFAGAIDV